VVLERVAVDEREKETSKTPLASKPEKEKKDCC
jgi:hypothetical protein